MKVDQFKSYLEKTDNDLYNHHSQLNEDIAGEFAQLDPQELIKLIRHGLEDIKSNSNDAELHSKIANFEKYMDLVDEYRCDNGNTVLNYELLKQLNNIQKLLS